MFIVYPKSTQSQLQCNCCMVQSRPGDETASSVDEPSRASFGDLGWFGFGLVGLV